MSQKLIVLCKLKTVTETCLKNNIVLCKLKTVTCVKNKETCV